MKGGALIRNRPIWGDSLSYQGWRVTQKYFFPRFKEAFSGNMEKPFFDGIFSPWVVRGSAAFFLKSVLKSGYCSFPPKKIFLSEKCRSQGQAISLKKGWRRQISHFSIFQFFFFFEGKCKLAVEGATPSLKKPLDSWRVPQNKRDSTKTRLPLKKVAIFLSGKKEEMEK